MKKGNENRRKITLKKGGKGFKNASFWAINSKIIKMHNIYPCKNVNVNGVQQLYLVL